MNRLVCFFVFFNLVLASCTKEFILDVRVNPPNSGTVFPSEGTFKDGSTLTLNAAPNSEYVFSNWSGDASGSNTSVNVTIDDNKSVVANFRLRQYKLTTNVQGEGSISETIINTGKSTDYDSGTRVSLEAIPAQGYYFTGWSGALTGDINPAELTIDSPKSVTATFEKLSYELRVQSIGEGSVSEQIIDTGKSTDYLYDTTVRLTATSEEGSDFIEWEDEGAITTDNPYDVTITEPRFIKAIFEYDLFNEVVGKWKIKKKSGATSQQKRLSDYDVYSILFNRNRTFRLNYSSGQISGTFSVDSNSAITLNNVGSISNVQIVQGQINFNLTITSLFQFDVTGSQEQNYQPNKTSIPDQNFEQGLIDSGFDDTLDGYVDDATIQTVSNLDLSNRQISDFSGLEEFINLTDLNLSGNTVSSVLLYNFKELISLDLSNTGLTELDLSQNDGLTTLDLSNNSFTQLDLSQNNNLLSLTLTGNPNLSCVKVSDQIYQQIPSGWTYDSTTGFELECDCPTLSLISGNQNQIICDGEAMEDITFEFGGKDVNINVSTMPVGIQSNVTSGTVTISGTPIFTNDSYTFSVFTSDGNANCSQVSQTITLNKNQESPSLTLVSGSLNQTFDRFTLLDPIELSYGGSTASLTITNPVDSRWFTNQNYINIDETGNTVTLSGFLSTPGTYNGTITTNSIGGCDEIVLNIQITVTDVGGTFGSGGGGVTSGGTTTNDTNSGGTSSGTTSGGNTSDAVNFLAVGVNGSILTSEDGESWTSRSNSNVTGNLFGATYGNGVFVITGNDGTFTSSNGISWSRTGSGSRKVLYANGKFVGGPGYSTDGTNWSSGCSGWGIAYGDGKFVYVPYSYSNHTYSTDGINCQSSDKISYNYDSGQGYLWDLAFGNGMFVAAAGNGNSFYVTSPDGINWTQRFFSRQGHRMNTISFVNNRFVGVGGNGSISISTDGINWTEKQVNPDPNKNGTLQSITYGNGKYVIGGSIRESSSEFYDGVYTSTDLQNWTSYNIGSSGQYGFYYMIYKN